MDRMEQGIYDQELDFSWVEHIRHSPTSVADEEQKSAEWHAPSFVCKRDLPSRRRAFVAGMGGTLDFLGVSRLWQGTTYYRIRELPPNRANALAIYGDWCAIGEDLNSAVRDFEHTELNHIELSNR